MKFFEKLSHKNAIKVKGQGKNWKNLSKKSPKTPEIWLKTGRNFRNFGAFCPKFRENFLAALKLGLK